MEERNVDLYFCLRPALLLCVGIFVLVIYQRTNPSSFTLLVPAWYLGLNLIQSQSWYLFVFELKMGRSADILRVRKTFPFLAEFSNNIDTIIYLPCTSHVAENIIYKLPWAVLFIHY